MFCKGSDCQCSLQTSEVAEANKDRTKKRKVVKMPKCKTRRFSYQPKDAVCDALDIKSCSREDFLTFVPENLASSEQQIDALVQQLIYVRRITSAKR
jgi:hypothetical protein